MGVKRKLLSAFLLFSAFTLATVAQTGQAALVFEDAGIDMNGEKIEDLGSADSSDDAMPKADIISDFVNRDGDSMTGNLNMNNNNFTQVGRIDMNGNRIEDVGSADSTDDVMPRADILSEFVESGGDTMSGDIDMSNNDILNIGTTSGFSATGAIDMGSNQITDLGSPTASDHAVPQSWAIQNLVQDAGDTMTGDLDMNNNVLRNADMESMTATTDVDMNSNRIEDLQSADSTDDAMPKADILSTSVEEAGDTMSGTLDMGGNDIDNVGTLNANTKNFVQPINEDEEAVYTAQESRDARAVVEGSVYVSGRETVELPRDFTGVASDTNADMTVVATPRELATVAVTHRTPSEIVIETDTPVQVDYRVTAVRDGYEDKQVVRQR